MLLQLTPRIQPSLLGVALAGVPKGSVTLSSTAQVGSDNQDARGAQAAQHDAVDVAMLDAIPIGPVDALQQAVRDNIANLAREELMRMQIRTGARPRRTIRHG